MRLLSSWEKWRPAARQNATDGEEVHGRAYPTVSRKTEQLKPRCRIGQRGRDQSGQTVNARHRREARLDAPFQVAPGEALDRSVVGGLLEPLQRKLREYPHENAARLT